MERRGLPGTLCGAGAETEPEMSEAILTFQVQLSGVMETVLKSAMYEITRLVEDSFLEEVARSKQEVESLRQRLQWWESRRREREGGGRARCADCGRAGVPREGAHATAPPAPPGAEGLSAAAFTKRCSEQQDWSSTKRQDTAPPAGQRLTEQQGRQRAGETCGFYAAGSEHCAGSGDHLDSERGAWTAFKLGDSDSEAEAPGSSYTAEQKPASPSAGPAVEGGADSASPLHCLSVKSEGGAPHSVAVKEEVEIQPVCGEEIRADLAHTLHRRHRETWDRGDMQVENTAHLPPSQDAAKRLKAFSDKVESLTSQFRQQQHGPPEKSIKLNVSETTAQSNLDGLDRTVCSSRDSRSFFIVSESMQNHQSVRTGEKPFTCVQCGKHFTQLKNLQAHLKQHAGERPHRCTQCGKSFLYLSRLKIHLLSHTGERPFSCTHCEKSFLSFYDLKVHQRNHTGEKPYSCTQCGKCFTRLSILKEHQIIHSKEKSFSCTQCGKRFTRPSNLRAHLRRHIIAKPHNCTLCGKSFLYLCRLKRHQKKFHWADTS